MFWWPNQKIQTEPHTQNCNSFIDASDKLNYFNYLSYQYVCMIVREGKLSLRAELAEAWSGHFDPFATWE